MPAKSFSVDAYSAIYAAGGDAWEYPGSLPAGPRLLLEDQVVPITWRRPHELPRVRDTGTPVNTILRRRGSAPLENRMAQIAFGANRELKNLVWKFRHYRERDQTIPADLVMVPGWVHAADVVACNLGYWGYVYAALLLHRPPALDRPYLAGTRAPVAVLFLDEAQMQAIHASEGVVRAAAEARPAVNCDVALLDVTLLNGVALQAQTYALSLPYLSFDGRTPVPFAQVATQNRPPNMPAFDQAALFDQLVAALNLKGQRGIGNGRDLARRVRADAAFYQLVRRRIIAELALADADGVVRRGNAGLPGILSPEEAWAFRPN